MALHTITYAVEVTAEVDAPTREEALRRVRRAQSSVDLWEPLDMAAAERGEPAKGILQAHARIIGRPA